MQYKTVPVVVVARWWKELGQIVGYALQPQVSEINLSKIASATEQDNKGGPVALEFASHGNSFVVVVVVALGHKR